MKVNKLAQKDIDNICKKAWKHYNQIKDLTVPAKGAMEREKQVALLVAKYCEKRIKLKQVINDPTTDLNNRLEAKFALSQLPRSSSRTRIRKRCWVTGRPRAVDGFTNLGRHAMRALAGKGELPGIKKVSW